MSSNKQLDAMGDRLKHYERIETEDRFIPNLPIYIRLDGRGFSRFTKPMERPYDKRMSDLMIATTKYLHKEFNAQFSFCQSDEINLIINNTYESPCIFEGKKQKLISTLAASCTAFFNANLYNYFDDFIEQLKDYPTFDCRAFNLPNVDEVSNSILWRYLDASKNSKQMLGHHHFSHKELHCLRGNKIVDKLLVEKNIDWNTYPEFFKNGTLIKKFTINKGTEEEPIIRHEIRELTLEQPFYLYSHDERKDIIHG